MVSFLLLNDFTAHCQDIEKSNIKNKC